MCLSHLMEISKKFDYFWVESKTIKKTQFFLKFITNKILNI